MACWKILKGFHFSFSNILQRFRLHYGIKPVTIQFSFDQSCWYPYKDQEDMDINKLVGFSFGNHHDNSVRIGWKPCFDQKGKIELYFYTYNNGKRFFTLFSTVNCNYAPEGVTNDYQVKISFMNEINYLNFELFKNGQAAHKSSIPFTVPDHKLGYWLWFYFGGTKTAPQKMKANIKIL